MFSGVTSSARSPSQTNTITFRALEFADCCCAPAPPATPNTSNDNALKKTTVLRPMGLLPWRLALHGRKFCDARIEVRGRAARLFGGLQVRRRSSAQLIEQRGFVGLGGGEVALLDVAEAADFFRDGGDADGEMVIGRVEPRQHLFERCHVI